MSVFNQCILNHLQIYKQLIQEYNGYALSTDRVRITRHPSLWSGLCYRHDVWIRTTVQYLALRHFRHSVSSLYTFNLIVDIPNYYFGSLARRWYINKQSWISPERIFGF